MTQHTPGPWKRIAGERFRHDKSAGVTGPGGSYIAAALDLNRYDKDDEVEANAQLIAAAPYLLAAAEQAIRAMAALGNMLNWPDEIPQSYADAINALRAARDVARGDIPESEPPVV